MKPLTEQELAWLEARVGKYRWTDEDRRRIIADLRAARELPKSRTGLLTLMRGER